MTESKSRGPERDSGATDQDLLDIRQAAALLNVSEVSLRRWTNDGRLPCLRVGSRRVRRFRREDLYAFLDSDRGPAKAGTRVDSVGNAVGLDGMAIERGSHLCALYQNDLGRLKHARPFLADGIREDETCLLIAAAEVQEQILSGLRARGVDVERALRDGRLIVSEGMASGPEMFDFLERLLVNAGGEGGRLFRLVGDMAWALDKGIGIDELMAFERDYNHCLARRFPIVSLCQYDTRRFTGTAVHEALLCHQDTFSYQLSRFL
jgi:transcriptional repressor of dcmA and dcmR